MFENHAMIPRSGEKKPFPRTALLVGGAVLGVVLLLFGGTKQQATDEDITAQSAAVSADMQAYAAALEEKIRRFCEEVEGVGRAEVAVSLESGYRRVYAQEDTAYVMVGSGASRGTVYLTEEPPRIGGIAVICTGGRDPTVCRRLLGLLSAAYDIGTNKIYIAPAQN